MKAYVLYGADNLKYEESRKKTELHTGEVLVKVAAAGICGSDIPRIFVTGAHHHPLIPGHEFSGTVVETGEGCDTRWMGRRVGVFPLIPCRKCLPCRNNQFEMCRNYNYLGSRCDGGFAEYVAVPQANLIELPDDVSFEEAAMLEPMSVAVHAIRAMELDKKSCVHSDRYVAICGLGTIGLFIAMFLKENGIDHIFVIGNKDYQRECILRLGILKNHYYDSRNGEADKWLLEQTNGNGVDVFFECVGKNETVSQAVSAAAPSGKVILVGNPASDMNFDQQIYWKILRNQLNIYGTWNSSFTGNKNDDWHYVLERLADKSIHPTEFISHRFALKDLKQGLDIMRNKSEDYVKIMCYI